MKKAEMSRAATSATARTFATPHSRKRQELAFALYSVATTPTMKNTTSDLPWLCFRCMICKGLKEKEPLASTAQVAFCMCQRNWSPDQYKDCTPVQYKNPPDARCVRGVFLV